MVWFSCESCGDSIKKPKLQAHFSHCSASRLTCLDCNTTFDKHGAKAHNACVTEHQKYAEGATKPGGIAATSLVSNPRTQQNQTSSVVGADFLATRPPWNCRLCNVNCTSYETLQGHAAGLKHIRKTKAALASQPSADLQRSTEPVLIQDQDTSLPQATVQCSEPVPTSGAGEKQKHGASELDEVPRKKRKKTGSEPEEEQVELGKTPTSSKKQKPSEARKAKTKVDGGLVPIDDPQQVLTGNSDARNKGTEGKVDSESKGEQKTWKALPWDSLAVAYLKRLGRRDFAEFRKELIADSGLTEPQDSRLDSHVKKALKRSPLLQVKGSIVGLV